MTDLWLCLQISASAAVISGPRGIRNDSVLTEIDSDVSSFTPPPSATWEKREKALILEVTYIDTEIVVSLGFFVADFLICFSRWYTAHMDDNNVTFQEVS